MLYFSEVETALFATVLGRYTQGTAVPSALQPGAVGYTPPAAAGADQ